MAFDESTVLSVIAGESTNEEKTQKILAEHTAEKSGLEAAKNKLLAEKKELQGKYEKLSGEIEPERESFRAQIQELEEKAKKGGSEEAKAAYEAQLKREKAVFEAELAKKNSVSEELEKKYANLLENRRLDLVHLAVEDAITKCGVTVPEDRANMREKFLYKHGNDFFPGENDNIPVNKEYKTVQEVINFLAGTPEYKRFIPNQNTGGGAPGATHGSSAKPNSMPRERFDKMSVQEQMDFATKGGTVV